MLLKDKNFITYLYNKTYAEKINPQYFINLHAPHFRNIKNYFQFNRFGITAYTDAVRTQTTQYLNHNYPYFTRQNDAIIVNIINYQILSYFIKNPRNFYKSIKYKKKIKWTDKFYPIDYFTLYENDHTSYIKQKLHEIKLKRIQEANENKEPEIFIINDHEFFYIIPTVSHAIVLAEKPDDEQKRQEYQTLAEKLISFQI